MPATLRKVEKTISLIERRRDRVHALSWQVVPSATWSPPTDLYETQENYVVRMELAGMSEADFSISYEGGQLIINGARPDISLRRAYHQMEIRTGRFATSVGLPGGVDVENSHAEYADGFLTITLPKARSSPLAVQSKD